MIKPEIVPSQYAALRHEIVDVVETARRASARNVNAVMTAAYWEIGRRIVNTEQGGQERAEYGQALIVQLADDLTRRFGRGFSRANLVNMRAFYLAWPADCPDPVWTICGLWHCPDGVWTIAPNVDRRVC